MKAALVYGENDIRMAEVPTPHAGPGEVLVKVQASGVCATDVKILGGSGLPKHLPTILGHEVAGTIEALGEGVTGLKAGARVAVYPIAACGQCFFCQRGRHSLCLEPFGLAHGADGGFAEYLRVPRQIVELQGIIDIGEMPFDLAAMIEPVSCCLSAAEQCHTQAGDTVLVIGCGTLGLLHTIVSKARGARVIAVEPNTQRLATAREVGADETIDPRNVNTREEVRRLTGVGDDIVIAAVGSAKVVEDSLPLVRNGGVFNIFGGTPKGETMTVDPRWLHYGEIVLTGTFAASRDTFAKAVDFTRENAAMIDKVISVRCSLDGILNAVEQTRNGTALKTVVVM